MTCGGTDEEVDEYFRNLFIMNFYNENYLSYEEVDEPLLTEINWSSESIKPENLEFRIYGAKLAKFESNDSWL